MLKMIAAMSEDRVIGHEGKIPRHMPWDLNRFRELIKNKIVVMGRDTYNSLHSYFPDANGHPLAKENIILSKTLQKEWLHVESDVQNIVNLYGGIDEEVRVIGGQQIYEAFLKHVDELYLTLVQGKYEGDAFFPENYTDFLEEVSKEPWVDEWSDYILYKKK
jgi:dihydrofolate reductase